jgi:hypothetical protein
MKKPSRSMDRRKVFVGVGLMCAAVLMMLADLDEQFLYWRAGWISLLALGLVFYLWGRFFSRGED